MKKELVNICVCPGEVEPGCTYPPNWRWVAEIKNPETGEHLATYPLKQDGYRFAYPREHPERLEMLAFQACSDFDINEIHVEYPPLKRSTKICKEPILRVSLYLQSLEEETLEEIVWGEIEGDKEGSNSINFVEGAPLQLFAVYIFDVSKGFARVSDDEIIPIGYDCHAGNPWQLPLSPYGEEECCDLLLGGVDRPIFTTIHREFFDLEVYNQYILVALPIPFGCFGGRIGEARALKIAAQTVLESNQWRLATEKEAAEDVLRAMLP